MRLRLKTGKRRYKVRATVVAAGGSCDCGGGAGSPRGPAAALTTTFDAACHRGHHGAGARAGTRLKVRFGGTDTLKPKRSRRIRLFIHLSF